MTFCHPDHFEPAAIRVIARTSGFLRYNDGVNVGPWQRFDNTAIESGYRVDDILAALSDAGWANAWAGRTGES